MSEKMREDFHEWCRSIGFTLKMNALGNDYAIGYGLEQWSVWQASRAALVVELPQKPYCAQGMAYPDYSDALNDCREAIESVGVKCK